MPYTPDLSPSAQAILRAIQNEAQARRLSDEPTSENSSTPAIKGSAVRALSSDDSADRLLKLVDHFVEHTENIRAQMRQIEQSLDRLSGVLAEAVAPLSATPAPAPSTERQPGDARLIAIEMALSGASRGEVREHLARELGLSDATPILDDIFGAGSAESARTPWND